MSPGWLDGTARCCASDQKPEAANVKDAHAFEDQNDVRVNALPSFVRIALQSQTPQECTDAVTSATTRSWGDLTAFDKTLLGRPSDANVTTGWAKPKEIVASQRAKLKRDGRSF